VKLTINKVPEEVLKLIKERAFVNHRSLQRELSAILENAAAGITFEQALERVDRRALRTRGDSTAMIRKARDSRTHR
jgi:plasmid stability protein